MVIYALSMATKIMSLYSITKEEVKSRRKIDGDLRLKMPQFSEFERERVIGVFLGRASYNVVVMHFNVHRTIV